MFSVHSVADMNCAVTGGLGKKLEGLWHTGVVVYGREYFFGGGIQVSAPGAASSSQFCLGPDPYAYPAVSLFDPHTPPQPRPIASCR